MVSTEVVSTLPPESFPLTTGWAVRALCEAPTNGLGCEDQLGFGTRTRGGEGRAHGAREASRGGGHCVVVPTRPAKSNWRHSRHPWSSRARALRKDPARRREVTDAPWDVTTLPFESSTCRTAAS